jgi:hypothetical protein
VAVARPEEVAAVRRIILLLATTLLIGLAACTPEQVAMFHTLSPDDQAKVVDALRAQHGPSLHPFLVCVRRHESDRGPYPHANGYRAQNPSSSASGAYQWLDGSWATVSRMAGYPGYPTASSAPPWVQDAVTLYVISNPSQTGGKRHWAGTGCPGS